MITKTYNIQGMTCTGCVKSVQETLSKLPDVLEVTVNLEHNQALIKSSKALSDSQISGALPSKYTSSGVEKLDTAVANTSKLAQLKPLFIILLFIAAAAVLMNKNTWDYTAIMLDFMGLFLVVFSFFKLLDLKGFPATFAMYDPLAKLVPAYGWVYPFIELALGVAFLMRFELAIALVGTIIILGITTVGVSRALLGKKQISCACLGTVLKLPMTQATFIENAIMLFMAVFMIFKLNLL